MIKIQGIKKTYHNFELHPITFELHKGVITALIGPNGAGKSTLLKTICGLKTADEGKILLNGKETRNLSEELVLGYLSQEQEIYPDVRLMDINRFVKKACTKHWSDDKFQKYFSDIFQLNETMKIKELSTGMRVKYFMALELAKQPEVLLLDEPTSGLDPMIREEVLEILQNLSKEEGVTILFSSHITEDIEKIGERVIYLYDGQILLDEAKDKIKKRYFQFGESDIENMPQDLQKIVKQSGVKIQDYVICDQCEDERFKKYGKEALLSDVLICLKEGRKHD